MKYFFDTEFIEADGFVDLISIGVKCEDGRAFYLENSEVDWRRASPWVLDNVKPKLTGAAAATTKSEIGARLAAFVRVGEAAEFWAYYADYDWVALCSTFGTMIWLPAHFPLYCRDLKQWMDELGVERAALAPDPEGEHNALVDAEWAEGAWAALNELSRPKTVLAGDINITQRLYDAEQTLRDWNGTPHDVSREVLRETIEALAAAVAPRVHPLASEFDATPADEFDADTDAAKFEGQVAAGPKPLCIYHGNCADGFTSAWAVWRRFGPAFDYHAGVYGEAPPDVSGRDVVLVDFSYKRPVLVEMRKRARSILVLDHHKTAAEDLAAGDGFIDTSSWNWSDFGRLDPWARHLDNAYQDECEGAHNTVRVLFDMERSGAGITWDFFHPEFKTRPALVSYVEDRDLWRFKKNGSREISAYIFAHAYSFDNWEKLYRELETEIGRCVNAGKAIERKHHKDIAELVDLCKRRMTIGGHEVWAASLPYTLTSDAGNLMAQGEPFAACYWDTPKGRVFSLRSTEAGLDVAEIAKAYGGGGHKNAAGFTLAYTDLNFSGAPIAAQHVERDEEAA